jgi:hypothetical protein
MMLSLANKLVWVSSYVDKTFGVLYNLKWLYELQLGVVWLLLLVCYTNLIAIQSTVIPFKYAFRWLHYSMTRPCWMDCIELLWLYRLKCVLCLMPSIFRIVGVYFLMLIARNTRKIL